MTIFDLVKAQELVAYWENMIQDRPPMLGEELWPNDQKLGMDLSWLKGASGLPVVLKPSAFDVNAIPRARMGFDKLSAEMPFFKESLYVDEKLRQDLNMAMETGNQAYIRIIVDKIFNDEVVLLEAAAARREQMRFAILSTGSLTITANGQSYSYDYGVPTGHKPTVTTSWSTATADIATDIRTYQDTVEDKTGVRPTRAICSRKTWGYMLKNTNFRNGILGNNSGVAVTDAQLYTYLRDTLDMDVVVYTKRFKDDTGTSTKYMPDDIFVMLPPTALGKGWFGTTPEQSDLMSSKAANVAIVDTGVAVTTIEHADPVTVETKVTQLYLPDFPTADQICIVDVIAVVTP